MELNERNQRLETHAEPIFVSPPPAHQGLADALRAVYSPVNGHLPEDLRRLLDQLN